MNRINDKEISNFDLCEIAGNLSYLAELSKKSRFKEIRSQSFNLLNLSKEFDKIARYIQPYTPEAIIDNYTDNDILNESKQKKEDNPFYNEKIQKVLNQIISEEWIAGNTYNLFILAVKNDERNIISESMVETANDELYDHMKSLIDFAVENRYDIPTSYTEFKRYANKDDVKLFERFKKNQDALYYINEAIESEKRAIEIYEKILDMDEMAENVDLQIIIKNNFFDEQEHLETFSFIKYTIEANLNQE